MSRRGPRCGINEAKRALGWEFAFLSADPTSFDDAARFGVKVEARLHFKKSAQGSARAWGSVSTKVRDYRRGFAQNVEFDEADRDAQDAAEMGRVSCLADALGTK